MERRLRFLTLVVLAVLVLTLSGIAVAADVPDKAARPAEVTDPLVRVLLTKGILTEEEASALAAAPAAQQQSQLVQLLVKKGVLSPSDVVAIPSSNERMVNFSTSATVKPAVMVETMETSPLPQAAPKPPPVIAAVAPIRVLAIDTPKRDGLIPAFKLGAVKVTPYGYIKMSVVHDSSSPLGNDFPLPGFIGDTGPDSAAEFRVKARNTRLGSTFEWLDRSQKLALTGKIELDFEGNYTTVANRGISTLRSSQPSLRLAYGRFDYAATPTTTVFGVFGQDWTPFGSSTLPATLEGTGVGIGYGSLYERGQQVRGGFVHNFGGSRTLKLLMEAAAVMPSSGNQPFPFPATNQFQIPGTVSGSGGGSNASNFFLVCPPGTTTCTSATAIGNVTIPQIGNSGLGVGNQLAIGERQGADSGRPEVEGRIALQFQLDKAPGVAPAQLIISGVQGERDSIVLKANIPNGNTTVGQTFYQTAFPRGVRANSERWGINPQIQLPTRWFTLIGSLYHGADLRWFFAGQILSFYNDTTGLSNTVTAPNIDGSSVVVLGSAGGVATVAPQRPIRTTGGFLELGLPLSRWAHAEPGGRNSGWTMNLHYGLDDVNDRDLRKNTTGSIRDRSDWAFANLMYKMNNWVTFGFEEGMYRTRAYRSAACANGSVINTTCYGGTLFRGLPARSWHDTRSEFSTIFTF